MHIIRLFAILLGLVTGKGQEAYCQPSNPFELRNSSDQPRIQSDSVSLDSVSFNPFELRPSFATSDQPVGLSSISAILKRVGDTPANPSEVKNFLFWLLLFLTFLLAIALNLNRSYVNKLYQSNFNLNLASVMFRESREDSRLITFILYGLYFAGLSVFIFLSYNLLIGPIHYYFLVYITFFITSIYVIRHLSLKLLGWVFGIQKETERYLFNIVSFGCLFSLLLIPLDFVLSFAKEEFTEKLIFWVFGLFVLAYLFRQAKEVLLAANLWRNSIVHFLLYLCTFEIAPFLLLYEIIRRTS
ncbi:MAG: DUF4271 domain-containing protein [Saprospiraceae bacterium]|nr:DUF4271 domain-containing protein [Saprospiraceae bacterium]